jgi:hypothetical protein
LRGCIFDIFAYHVFRLAVSMMILAADFLLG